MKHWVLTRSAYGPSWDVEANRRRLEMTCAVTIRSLASQTTRHFRWLVLLHSEDPLLHERRRAFGSIGADFLYLDATGTSSQVASAGYRAGWAAAIGPRDETVLMTRLDDDDGFAPWAMAMVQARAERITRRTALLYPFGIRVWDGAWDIVRHGSNAMQTLVTPPGDTMTVYDYLHRQVKRIVPVRVVDTRPAWIWSRHPDTLSGWRTAERPLTDEIRAMFSIDWSIFGAPKRHAKTNGRFFR